MVASKVDLPAILLGTTAPMRRVARSISRPNDRSTEPASGLGHPVTIAPPRTPAARNQKPGLYAMTDVLGLADI
ncbi:MAG: hypothetical protein WBD53_16180 [Xanthobacteraceae bacterium]